MVGGIGRVEEKKSSRNEERREELKKDRFGSFRGFLGSNSRDLSEKRY